MVPAIAMWLGCGASDVSIGAAGRVVLVIHLIASWRLRAGPLTTTMEHRGGSDHGNAPSSWLRRGLISRRSFEKSHADVTSGCS
jgi:hypothetical protein